MSTYGAIQFIIALMGSIRILATIRVIRANAGIGVAIRRRPSSRNLARARYT